MLPTLLATNDSQTHALANTWEYQRPISAHFSTSPMCPHSPRILSFCKSAKITLVLHRCITLPLQLMLRFCNTIRLCSRFCAIPAKNKISFLKRIFFVIALNTSKNTFQHHQTHVHKHIPFYFRA